jgi:AI-2 transport protein TqsA
MGAYSFIYLVFLCVAYVGSKISTILEQNENSLTRLTYKLDFSFLNYSFGIRDIDPNIIVNSLKQLSWGAMELGSFLLLVHVFLFFLFFDKDCEDRWSKYEEYFSDVGTYVGVKILLASVTAAILGVVFSIYELKLTASLVILIFLLDLLPNIGALLAVLVPLPIAYFQYGTGVEFFSLLGALVAAQVIIGNFVEPKLIGTKLGLSPILVVIAMVFWGIIWGAAGVFLAIPITLVLKKVLIKQVEI